MNPLRLAGKAQILQSVIKDSVVLNETKTKMSDKTMDLEDEVESNHYGFM